MELAQRLRLLLGDAAVRTEPDALAPYLEDHRQLFSGSSPAVVLPKDTNQVSQFLAFCNEARIGVVPHGGNTSYCGGATPSPSGDQLVLSLARLNRIRSTLADDFAIVVEAGCTLADVHEAATAAERLFPLRLGSEGSCQIGGNLATNAGGTAVLRYGMMRDLVLGIEAVFADGSVVSMLSPLRKDNTGYDLKQLLIGSEGTLAVMTAACLKLFPLPKQTVTAWVSLKDAAAAVQVLSQLRSASADRLSSCELIPATALDLVLQHIPATRAPLLQPTTWYLLLEMTSSGDEDLNQTMESALAELLQQGAVLDAAIAQNEAQRLNFWRLRETVPAAQRQAGASLKHDVSVPISRVPILIERGAALVAKLVPEGDLVAYGHLGDGNLHFNVSQRPGSDRAAFMSREAVLQRAIHDLVAELDGSFSAEHGIGQLKIEELQRYAPPAKLAAMRRIKRALDPHNILNPGKLL